MADISRWRRIVEPVLTIGEYPGEPETRRSGRRVFLIAFLIATVSTIPQAIVDISAGYAIVGVMNLVSVALTFPFLVAMKVWPHRFTALVNGTFVLIFVTQLAETAMFGGLFPSGLVVIFGMALGLAALIAIGLRAAVWWSVAFAASVVYAVVVPDWVDPVYELADPALRRGDQPCDNGVLGPGRACVLRAATRSVPAAVRRAAARDPARRDRATHEGGRRDDRRRSRRGVGAVRRRGRLHADVGVALARAARGAAPRSTTPACSSVGLSDRGNRIVRDACACSPTPTEMRDRTGFMVRVIARILIGR